MIFIPKINTGACVVPLTQEEQLALRGSTCPDPRCKDADFAAANPDICSLSDGTDGTGGPGESGGPPLLILKPSTILVCKTSTAQLSTFVVVNSVEQEVTDGVVYESSDTAIATVDSNGVVTGVEDGIVSITASWQGMLAHAQVSIIGSDENCCDAVKVSTFLQIDRSKSMRLPFGNGYASKMDYAKELAKSFADGLNVIKDKISVFQFSENAEVIDTDDSDVDTIKQAINSITPSSALHCTSIFISLDTAALAFVQSTADVNVMLLLSDGSNTFEYSPGHEEARILELADNIKIRGGIIICVGVRAGERGFNLLNQIASPGYMLNAVPDNAQATIDNLNGLKGYFCAGACGSAYGSGCLTTPPDSQGPDATAFFDNETEQEYPPTEPPSLQLPPVIFTPDDSTPIPLIGMTVALSVPGFPTARIRYSVDGSHEPPNPSFNFPPNDRSNFEYEGSRAPISLGHPVSGTIKIKAIAHLDGYIDSEISRAEYAGA